MTTSQRLIQDCNQHIELLMKLRETITANASEFDKWGSGSVGTGCTEMVFIHDAPEDSKALPKAIGGQWQRERDGAGKINFRQSGKIDWILFGAETVESLPPLEI